MVTILSHKRATLYDTVCAHLVAVHSWQVHLFERKKAAAAALVAEHEAAQAVLSGLSLDPQDLVTLWSSCNKLDKDSSGCLTGKRAAIAAVTSKR